MRKIFIPVLIMIVIVMLLTSLSVFEFPFLENLKKGDKTSSTTTGDGFVNPSDTTNGGVSGSVVTGNTFSPTTYYVSEGSEIVSYGASLASIPSGSRGFYYFNNTAYYFVKFMGKSNAKVFIDSGTYGSYEYCFKTASNFSLIENYSYQSGADYVGDRLVIYAMSSADVDLRATHNDLVTNYNPNVRLVFNDSVFVYTSGGKVFSTTLLSSVADGTRGYYNYNGTSYFAIKSSGSDTLGAYLRIDDKSYGGYNYCFYRTTDMRNYDVESEDTGVAFDEDSLIVYATVLNCKDPAVANGDLISNVHVVVDFSDPGEIEGPGAE